MNKGGGIKYIIRKDKITEVFLGVSEGENYFIGQHGKTGSVLVKIGDRESMKILCACLLKEIKKEA